MANPNNVHFAEKCDIEEVITADDSIPLLFDGFIEDWNARSWTPETLASNVQDKFSCKIAPRNSDQLMETECFYEDASLKEFYDWVEGNALTNNPLNQFDRQKVSCYVDYKYMKNMFAATPEMLWPAMMPKITFSEHYVSPELPVKSMAVKWDEFGLAGRNGYDSTIWIGSPGANTPLHYDTYGFNLIAQIYGSKQWVLFPPSDTPNLYPTRIPYEESSVFGQVNIKCPNIHRHSKFKNCHPYVVTLKPGQVLYVPRHWWHYVECIETSISINTWVEMPEDNISRLQEAVTRTLFTALLPALTEEDTGHEDSVVNPHEILYSRAVNLTYLQQSLQSLSDAESNPSPAPNNLQKFAGKFIGVPIGKLFRTEVVEELLEHVCAKQAEETEHEDIKTSKRFGGSSANKYKNCSEMKQRKLNSPVANVKDGRKGFCSCWTENDKKCVESGSDYIHIIGKTAYEVTEDSDRLSVTVSGLEMSVCHTCLCVKDTEHCDISDKETLYQSSEQCCSQYYDSSIQTVSAVEEVTINNFLENVKPVSENCLGCREGSEDCRIDMKDIVRFALHPAVIDQAAKMIQDKYLNFHKGSKI